MGQVLCPHCNEFYALVGKGVLKVHKTPRGGLCLGSGQKVEVEEELVVPKIRRTYKKKANRGGIIE